MDEKIKKQIEEIKKEEKENLDKEFKGFTRFERVTYRLLDLEFLPLTIGWYLLAVAAAFTQSVLLIILVIVLTLFIFFLFWFSKSRKLDSRYWRNQNER